LKVGIGEEKADDVSIMLPLALLSGDLSSLLLGLPAEKRAAAIARFARIGFEKKTNATAKRGLGDPPGNVALVDFLGGTIRWFA